jgi:hypothetical protein
VRVDGTRVLVSGRCRDGDCGVYEGCQGEERGVVEGCEGVFVSKGGGSRVVRVESLQHAKGCLIGIVECVRTLDCLMPSLIMSCK